jgi:hypothetical protein
MVKPITDVKFELIDYQLNTLLFILLASYHHMNL